jgi:ligand-binding sensor domain-containing protein/signal transduction histidine kinase
MASQSIRTRLASTLAAALASAFASPAEAQQLAVRRYGVSDGLANARISEIRQDSRGFLWIATWEGLSRFDGERFENYGANDGLASLLVNSIAEDPAGRLWVATNGAGVARLRDDERATPRFASYAVAGDPAANRVNVLFFDSTGALWCHTDGGVYAARSVETDELRFERMLEGEPDRDLGWSHTALCDRSGRVWVAIRRDLAVGSVHGLARVAGPPEVDRRGLAALAEDRQGRIYAADSLALFVLRSETLPRASEDWERLPLALAPDQELRYLFFDSVGVLWIATTRGLLKYTGEHSVTYSGANGFGDDFVRTVAEDREGTLWIGTTGAGIAKFAGEAWLAWTREQGLADQDVVRVIESLDGRIFASTRRGGLYAIRAGRAESVSSTAVAPFANVNRRVAQDALGRWWFGTEVGLWRAPGPEPDVANAVRIEAEVLNDIASVDTQSTDAPGAVWVSDSDGSLHRFAPDGSRSRLVAAAPSGLRTRALRDRRGGIWVGTTDGIGRVAGDALAMLAPEPGLPETAVRALFEDSRGWLWFGLRAKGVSFVRDADREPPSFRNLSTLDGLASDTVWSVCEGEDRAIYLGTGRGLDRLDPADLSVEHVRSLGELGGDIVNHCLRDRSGAIWIGTSSGIASYRRDLERARLESPPVWITRARVAGVDRPVGVRGTRSLSLGALGSSENQVEIEFKGLSFLGERGLQYRWRLDGLDADWRPPTQSRSVDLVELGAGRYRFRVEASSPAGAATPREATVEFEILPPLWQRPWFIGVAIALAAALGYALHQSRMARAVAMERVRRQIAFDLHDELGAGLAQIAIHSEVAKREVAPAPRLDAIAGTARALRESMSDIVWSVDPRKDHLLDLVQRMRQLALDVLEAAGVRVDFRAPEDASIAAIDLAPDRRRHVLLLFKEAVTNVARHAHAENVEIRVGVSGSRMRVEVKDDGCGFDQRAARAGHGLDTLRRRAEELDAELLLESTPYAGTRIAVDVPLRGPALRSRRGASASAPPERSTDRRPNR